MKKCIAIFVALTLLLCLLSGCGGGVGSNSSVVDSLGDSQSAPVSDTLSDTSDVLTSSTGDNQTTGTTVPSTGKNPSGGTGGRTTEKISTTTKKPVAADQTYQLVQSKYDKNDVFVIAIDVTKTPYAADKTGKTDVTKILNRALKDCYTDYGGGIVYLPAGKYLISGTLTIPSDVTLKGEYNDPDDKGFNGDYGTVLLAKTASTSTEGSPLIKLENTAVLNGVTVYYPDQSGTSPKPYPYTIYTGLSWNYVANVTLLNSYKGIAQSGVSSPDMADIFVQNVKGTVLYQGYQCNNAGDAVFTDSIHFSPSYWASAGSAYNAPKESALRSWMSKNSDYGLYVSGTEGGMFTDVVLDNYKTGVKIGANQGRPGTEAYGGYLGVRVKNATDGMMVTHTFGGMGVQLTDCDFNVSGISFRNTSSNNCYLVNVTGTGSIGGRIKESKATITVPYAEESIARPTKLKLYNVLDYGADKMATKDAAPAVQKALDAAAKNGGGYVFMPAGNYRFDTSVKVSANTQLTGSNGFAIGQGQYGGGTNIFAYYGEGKGANDTAMITLAGKGAGVTGLHIHYPKNGAMDVDNIQTASYAFAVRGKAQGVYAESLTIKAASRGVEMVGANGFTITRVETCCFDNTYSVRSSQNGVITLCMQHPGYMTTVQPFKYREHFKNWPSFENTGNVMAYTGYRATFLQVQDSTNITLQNAFMYHQQTFTYAKNSSVNVLNVFARFTDGNSKSCAYRLEGGSLHAYSTVYKSCHVHEGEDTGTMRIYNANGVGNLSGGDILP